MVYDLSGFTTPALGETMIATFQINRDGYNFFTEAYNLVMPTVAQMYSYNYLYNGCNIPVINGGLFSGYLSDIPTVSVIDNTGVFVNSNPPLDQSSFTGGKVAARFNGSTYRVGYDSVEGGPRYFDFTTPGTFNRTIPTTGPEAISSFGVEIQGAGGAGGGVSLSANYGTGGGGGGYYVNNNIPVSVASTSLSITVPGSVTGATVSGGNGGAARVNYNLITYNGLGGQGGGSNRPAGSPGGAGGGVTAGGTASVAGQDGGPAGNDTNRGGNSGSGAAGGGAPGSGFPGNPGAIYGAGGSGARGFTFLSTHTGGNGAQGRVEILYNCPN